MPHTTGCACGSTWRVEAADLATGRVKAVLHPVSWDWQVNLSTPGRGSITLVTKDVASDVVWSHLTSVWIIRERGLGVSARNPVVEWAGYVDSFQAEDTGTLQVGLLGLEDYLNHRLFDSAQSYTGIEQTQLGAALVNLAGVDGIPLVGEATPSSVLRDRVYELDANVGEAVNQLTMDERGVEWETLYGLDEGTAVRQWRAAMVFQDRVGTDRDLAIRSAAVATEFDLEVDAQNHATRVIGQGAAGIRSVAVDTGPYPRFDVVQQWSDDADQATLDQHTAGLLASSREPVAVPSVTLPDLDVDPALTRPGDTVDVDTSYGTVTYRGRARITAVSWKVDDGGTSRTLDFEPVTRASDSVLGQRADAECNDC